MMVRSETEDARESEVGNFFMCSVCKFRFKNDASLKHHLKITKGKRIYECSEESCDYRCHTRAQLNVHTYRHSGRRPYRCEFCSKDYFVHSSLSYHIRLSHQSEWKKMALRCADCDYTCAHACGLSKHLNQFGHRSHDLPSQSSDHNNNSPTDNSEERLEEHDSGDKIQTPMELSDQVRKGGNSLNFKNGVGDKKREDYGLIGNKEVVNGRRKRKCAVEYGGRVYHFQDDPRYIYKVLAASPVMKSRKFENYEKDAEREKNAPDSDDEYSHRRDTRRVRTLPAFSPLKWI